MDGRHLCASWTNLQRGSYTGYERGRLPLDVKLDRILTHRIWGFPIMLALLCGVFWLTIIGSNYPSDWLNQLLVV